MGVSILHLFCSKWNMKFRPIMWVIVDPRKCFFLIMLLSRPCESLDFIWVIENARNESWIEHVSESSGMFLFCMSLFRSLSSHPRRWPGWSVPYASWGISLDSHLNVQRSIVLYHASVITWSAYNYLSLPSNFHSFVSLLLLCRIH